MFKQKYFIILTLVGIVIMLNLIQPSVTALKYFPIDEAASFTDASTSLTVKQIPNKEPLLQWEIKSSHNYSTYLNQDVGLLYQNGLLKGIQSKWTQSDENMSQSIDFAIEEGQLYQAISYHYMEIHQTKNDIYSNYQLSSAQLYVDKDSNHSIDSFTEPKTDYEKNVADALQETTTTHLTEIWTTLINHYDIDLQSYVEIPLINLSDYQEKPLPGLSIHDTKRIIAQLWEGLYKNYILPYSQQEPNSKTVMPLILLDKDLEHLIVLFSDADQKAQQLIQKLNVN